MLQQTRVAAVIPYYERFLIRFPNPAALAAAPEPELLTLWSGLGYYSRVRNLQKAAVEIAALGAFPGDFETLRKLAGIGDYTAAAVASIAFDRPHAAVDGNVRRLIARLLNDDEAGPRKAADLLLDRRHPGRWNQAMMELGATVCLPVQPHCEACPLAAHCEARRRGTVNDLPKKRVKPSTMRLNRTLLIIRRGGRILLAPSSRVRGFWDLPEPFNGVRFGAKLGVFRHTITHRNYRFAVQEARVSCVRQGMRWFNEAEIQTIPVSTTATKALRFLT